jgi:lipoate-protein ligase A
MNLSRAKWRLIISPPAGGVWNMAVDEAILLHIHQFHTRPTLRLYAWSPPCLSLGYAQPANDIDFSRLATSGWHIVRRPTGGRAILHTDELTYSVIASADEPRLSGSVLESYQRLSRALLASLKLLGVDATSEDKANTDGNQSGENGVNPPNPVCFEVPSHYEITAGGQKLVGSAQARKKEGILQHGSIPLYGDLTRIVQVLRFESEIERQKAANRLLHRATTLKNILGNKLSWDEVVSAFVEGFKNSLNLEFVESSLTIEEIEQVDRLIKDKYANDNWTYRV